MLFTLIFCFSLLVVIFAIPPIIKVSFLKGLFDDPNEARKVHKRIVPNFGGIAIFTGFLFSCSLFIPSVLLPEAGLLIAGGLILFMTGLKDDIVGLSPLKKFTAQFTSAFIIAVMADIRIVDLHGTFGIGALPYEVSVLLTVFFIVGIVNAYNLIDGIDGLAGMMGIVFTVIFSALFFKSGYIGWSYLAISLTGGLIGFLFYNLTPAKIFMGDSGSLLVGYIASILSIKFLMVGSQQALFLGPLEIESTIGLVFAILIIPIFDTARVFTLRILQRRSPFTADSNHLHHRLLFLGLSHVQSTLVLAVTNILLIALALSLQHLGNTAVVGIVAATIFILNIALTIYTEQYKRSLFARRPAVSEEAEEEAASSDSKNFVERVLNKISEN